MQRNRISRFLKFAVIALGLSCFVFVTGQLPSAAISWGFLFLLAFGVLVAPRMSFNLPQSKFTLTFSDSIVFVAFLLYGPESAIFVAFIDTFAHIFYLRSKRLLASGPWMALFNASLSALIAANSFILFLLVRNQFSDRLDQSKSRNLVFTLALLAVFQFFGSSIFAAAYQYANSGDNIWNTWKTKYLTSSLTHFAGAALAGVVFKIANYADVAVAAVALVVFLLGYFSYRRMITDINESIERAEAAERAKAETERARRVEAEAYAEGVAKSLAKEEKINAALRQSEKDLIHAALYDSLTGLANRKRLTEVLRESILRFKSAEQAPFQVMFLDISRFKDINDSLGHTVGDKVLATLAKRFVRSVNATDTVARIGGDEFAIILQDLASPGKAQRVARKIYQNITEPYSLNGNTVNIDVNVGIASSDAEYETPEEILRDADIAMHFAKERGNGLAVFSRELRDRFLERVRLETDLRYAIERNELAVHYQPIISLSDGRLIGFEALLRWNHGEFGMIPPSQFIPIAEYSGLIQSLTVWILHETATRLLQWQQIAPEYADLIVSVNISGKHLANNDLIDDVQNTIAKTGISPKSLKLEMTESTAMENAEHTINVLNRLKAIGVRLSIDDFGTGYSSLSYLHRLSFDTLKIDRSFVYNVGEHGENSEILQTIISLAKNLKMRVIAEGIETESQLSVLQHLGCDFGQGFLLAKPKSREQTEKLLYENPSWLPLGFHGDYSERSAHADDRLPVF